LTGYSVHGKYHGGDYGQSSQDSGCTSRRLHAQECKSAQEEQQLAKEQMAISN
jgi:hypothetical protein